MKKSVIAIILVCVLAFAGMAGSAIYVANTYVLPIFKQEQQMEKQTMDEFNAFSEIFKLAEQSSTTSGNYKGPYLHNSYN